MLFDVGHGGGSFVFRNAVPAVQQGFYPDTISTDLHTGSMNGAMMDMLTTMSKFLAMGVPLNDVIRQSTVNPAKAIQHPELGHLSAGAEADIAVLRVMEGRFGYADGARGTIAGDRRLLCEMTLKGGRVVWDWNARTGTDYRKCAATTASATSTRSSCLQRIDTVADRARFQGLPIVRVRSGLRPVRATQALAVPHHVALADGEHSAKAALAA